jgi:SAM-dependent methyltransferase
MTMDDTLYRDHADMEESHWWFVGRRRIIADVMRQHLAAERGADRRLLDVGCGTGGMLGVLADFGRTSGLDISPEAIDLCRQRYGDRVDARVGLIPQDLPTPGSVDVVSVFDVIEHIGDDSAALRQLYRTLRPGGTLVVTVPAYPFLWSEHDDLNHHKRRYTRKELRQRLTEAGFRVATLSYFNIWLFPVVAAVRLLRKRSGGTGKSDFALPPQPVNALLAWLFASERLLLRRTSLPFGVSLIAVATKPTEAGAAGRAE